MDSNALQLPSILPGASIVNLAQKLSTAKSVNSQESGGMTP